MITEKNHKLLTSQLFVTDCTKKGLASMYIIYKHVHVLTILIHQKVDMFTCELLHLK